MPDDLFATTAPEQEQLALAGWLWLPEQRRWKRPDGIYVPDEEAAAELRQEIVANAARENQRREEQEG